MVCVIIMELNCAHNGDISRENALFLSLQKNIVYRRIRQHTFVGMYVPNMHFVWTLPQISLIAEGRFSRPRLRATQGGRVCSRDKLGPRPVLRGACSGRPRSLDLGCYGIAVRLPEPGTTLIAPRFNASALLLLRHVYHDMAYDIIKTFTW